MEINNNLYSSEKAIDFKKMIKSHAFRNGFVISSETLGSNLIADWESMRLPSANLYTHPNTKIVTSKFTRDGKNESLTIIGICYDVVAGISRSSILANSLVEDLRLSFDKLLRRTDNLAGRFVLVYSTEDETYIIPDAFATYACYCARKNGQSYVASHSYLLAQSLDLAGSKESEKIMDHKAYISPMGKYYPALLTPWDGVKQVFANHYLRMKHNKHIRYYPHTSLDSSEDTTEVSERFFHLFRSSIQMLFDNHKVFASLTGGGDSRVTFAACADLIKNSNSYFFTACRFATVTEHNVNDTVEAARICSITGCRHVLVDMPQYDYKSSFTSLYKSTFPKGARFPSLTHSYFLASEPDSVQLLSTISETGTTFYQERKEKDISPELLARKFTTSKLSEQKECISLFDDYIDYTNFNKEAFINYDFYDMFYWEHRNTKFHGLWYSEADLSHFAVVPYNCRKIVETMLELPFEARLNKKILKYCAEKYAFL